MSETLEYVKGRIADLEDDLQHYTMVDKDKAKEHFIKCELDKMRSVEKELRALEIIKKKRLNFDRFDYAIKYWKTTKEQVDAYNSGIGKCYRLTEEEFESVKEVLKDERLQIL